MENFASLIGMVNGWWNNNLLDVYCYSIFFMNIFLKFKLNWKIHIK
jgi:hypothetical protein